MAQNIHRAQRPRRREYAARPRTREPLVSERDGGPAGKTFADMFPYPIGVTALFADRRVEQNHRGVIAVGIEKHIRAVAAGRAVMPVVAAWRIEEERNR